MRTNLSLHFTNVLTPAELADYDEYREAIALEDLERQTDEYGVGYDQLELI